MKLTVSVESPVVRSARVQQLEGLFEVPPSQRSAQTWEVNLPIEEKPWNIGLIVGPSGCGKSTVARRLWPTEFARSYAWNPDRSLLDSFPSSLGIKDLTGLLSSVGFSSPPGWVKPFHVLSNGEQFRVLMARVLAEAHAVSIVDEFTSVVDRQVAQYGSAALGKAVRARGQRFIAVTCHYDVEEWLQPDWVYEPALQAFHWRAVQRRPAVEVEVVRADKTAWKLFEPFHYMSRTLHPAAKCFVALIDGRPAAFAGVLWAPHPTVSGYRMSRLVCLPDFQGIGLGVRLLEHVASAFACTGKPFFIASGLPSLIQALNKSPRWHMGTAPRLNPPHMGALASKNPVRKMTAGFRYEGPKAPDVARALGMA